MNEIFWSRYFFLWNQPTILYILTSFDYLSSNFSNRQKIQNLVYPSGIYFDKENDDYRTENENEVFKIFRRFTAVCEGEKEKATTDFARLSPSVGMRRVIVHVSASPKSWLLENDNMLIRWLHIEFVPISSQIDLYVVLIFRYYILRFSKLD